MVHIRKEGITQDGDIAEESLHSRDSIVGGVVYADDLVQLTPQVRPFFNSSFGVAMNQDVSFGGTPELILDGGSGGTEWTGTANAGTWDFAATGKCTITSANNNDSATFDDAGTIDMNNFTAISGKVDLDTYNPLGPESNTILIQFGLAGALLENSINLNDYIDTGNFSEQNFVIPKADLGISSLTVDEMTITLTRVGGVRPTIKFDDIQIEQTGNPAVFSVAPEPGVRFHIERLRFTFADNITGITTVAGATENATHVNLDYSTLLGVASLSNGISFQRTQGGVIQFSGTFKNIGDFLGRSFDKKVLIGNGTNAFLVLENKIRFPIVLDGDTQDNMTLNINDDLSGLIRFTALAGGGEVIKDL